MSKLVHEWILGWTRPNEDGEEIFEHNGHLKLFRNFDEHGNPFPRPNTLLIDSGQIESGELDKNFRSMATAEIDLFKTEAINFLDPCKTVGRVEWETLKWVNWYNTPFHGLQANHCRAAERLHSAIGYIKSQEAEEAFYENLNILDNVA